MYFNYSLLTGFTGIHLLYRDNWQLLFGNFVKTLPKLNGVWLVAGRRLENHFRFHPKVVLKEDNQNVDAVELEVIDGVGDL